MKYYYGVCNFDYCTEYTRRKINKGSSKAINHNGRVDYFDSVEVYGYAWNYTLNKWSTDIEKGCGYSSCRGNGPKSFKAFNRYVQKLLKEYDFPKGTVIQLESRFLGVGIYCIIGT